LGTLSEDDCRSSLILSSGFALINKRMSKFIQLLILLALLKVFAPEVFALLFDIFGHILTVISEIIGSLGGNNTDITNFGL